MFACTTTTRIPPETIDGTAAFLLESAIPRYQAAPGFVIFLDLSQGCPVVGSWVRVVCARCRASGQNARHMSEQCANHFRTLRQQSACHQSRDAWRQIILAHE